MIHGCPLIIFLKTILSEKREVYYQSKSSATFSQKISYIFQYFMHNVSENEINVDRFNFTFSASTSFTFSLVFVERVDFMITELIYLATSASGGRVKFFVSCANFLENSAKILIPKRSHLGSLQQEFFCKSWDFVVTSGGRGSTESQLFTTNKICLEKTFLSDPGVPGVRSMGPNLCLSVCLCDSD